jgi:hypothetical protein
MAARADKLHNPNRDKLDNGRGAVQLQPGASLPECAVHFETALLTVPARLAPWRLMAPSSLL